MCSFRSLPWLRRILPHARRLSLALAVLSPACPQCVRSHAGDPDQIFAYSSRHLVDANAQRASRSPTTATCCLWHCIRFACSYIASRPRPPGSLVRFLPRLSSLLCLVHLAVPLLLPACSFISTEPTCTRTPSTCNASRMSPLLVRCFASCLACLFFCSVLPVHPAVPVAPSCSSFISTQPMPRTPSNPSRMSLLLSPLRNTKQNFSSPTTRSPSPMKSHWRQAHHVDCVDNPVRCLAAAAKHWAWAG